MPGRCGDAFIGEMILRGRRARQQAFFALRALPAPPRTGIGFDVSNPSPLDRVEARVVRCRHCPRLVEYRERVGREKRRAFRDH
jgi:hypothetical protein